MATFTSIGNEGFHIRSGVVGLYIDAFYRPFPGVARPPVIRPSQAGPAELILVTHNHGDHFDAFGVAEAAYRTGARVIGPSNVIAQLRATVRPESLLELQPGAAQRGGKAQAAIAEVGGARVVAFGTFHSRDHNSYLVELPGLRFFHDGDNGDTRRIDLPALGKLDALLIGPWQGSGWVEFIDALKPRRYFLMHLSDEEIAQHERGRYLPDLCDHVPEGLVVLRAGQSYEL
jgi:L-ascorbate metabolism protein UlaG (beta-lactamase superfamily)